MKKKALSLFLCIAMILSYATQVMAERPLDINKAITADAVLPGTTEENVPTLSLHYLNEAYEDLEAAPKKR